MKAYEEGFYSFMDKNYPEVAHTLSQSKVLSDELAAKLKSVIARAEGTMSNVIPLATAAE